MYMIFFKDKRKKLNFYINTLFNFLSNLLSKNCFTQTRYLGDNNKT